GKGYSESGYSSIKGDVFIRMSHTVRTLINTPVFTLTAVISIALGIGASTAVFSVANAVFLRPLPYKNPDRLVRACDDMPLRNVKDFPATQPDFIDLRNEAKTNFEGFAGVMSRLN